MRIKSTPSTPRNIIIAATSRAYNRSAPLITQQQHRAYRSITHHLARTGDAHHKQRKQQHQRMARIVHIPRTSLATQHRIVWHPRSRHSGAQRAAACVYHRRQSKPVKPSRSNNGMASWQHRSNNAQVTGAHSGERRQQRRSNIGIMAAARVSMRHGVAAWHQRASWRAWRNGGGRA